jgi:hypothetical protein
MLRTGFMIIHRVGINALIRHLIRFLFLEHYFSLFAPAERNVSWTSSHDSLMIDFQSINGNINNNLCRLYQSSVMQKQQSNECIYVIRRNFCFNDQQHYQPAGTLSNAFDR